MSNRPTQKIAVIGFGFTGLMTVRHLVLQHHIRYELHIYDSRRMWAQGLAYATHDPDHLLNVPAGKMGAFAHNPEDFLRWLRENREKWRDLHEDFADIAFDSGSFVPRMIYAAYLEDIFTATQELAKTNGHTLRLHDAQVQDISPDLTITALSGAVQTDAKPASATTDEPATKQEQVQRVVLAFGHYGSRDILAEAGLHEAHPALLRHPWQPIESKPFWHAVAAQEWGNDAHYVVLGTGLTAVDLLHSLHRYGAKGRVTAISRSGQLPAVHRDYCFATPDAVEVDSYPRTADALFARLQQEVEEAGSAWRAAIDSMRPHSNAIWQRLPAKEQERFIARYLSWWGVKRHRMAPQAQENLDAWQQQGWLKIRSGTVVSASRDKHRFALTIETAKGKTKTLHADAILNAGGFSYRMGRKQHPLLETLHAKGLVQLSDTGVGLHVNRRYHTGCTPDGGMVYAVGPMLFGERLESTAVPELRVQAQELAQAIADDITGGA